MSATILSHLSFPCVPRPSPDDVAELLGNHWIDVSCHRSACEQFAKAKKQEDYSSRGQKLDPETIYQQQLIGKLGEFVAYEAITEKSYVLASLPDMRILSTRGKSFSPDLFCGSVGIAVKTCRFVSYRDGWICQWGGDNGRYDKDPFIFDIQKNVSILVVTVVFDNWKNKGVVFSANWACELNDKWLFDAPYKDNLKDSKRVIIPERLAENGHLNSIDEIQLSPKGYRPQIKPSL